MEQRIWVAYQSKYGTTRKYVKLLQGKLDVDVCDLKNEKLPDLSLYDVVIFAGDIYASGILGLNVLKKHLPELKNHKVAVFAVGASPYNIEAINELKKKRVPENIDFFYGRGRWDESIMSKRDQFLCKLLVRSLKKRDPETYEPWMKALMSSVGKVCDWVDEVYLEPLIDFIIS